MSRSPNLRFNSFTDPWNPVELGSLCEINPKSDPIPNEFVYIDLESVESGQLYEINVIRKEDAPSRAQRLLREKDVLFQTVRPYQKNHYIFKDVFDLPVVASTGFAQLRNEKSSEFIYHLLYSSRFEKQVLIRCTGSNYPAINSADLSEIEVFVPSILEQQKIASFFSLLDQKIVKQQEKIEQLELFKKGMLQKIFSQEIRFKDENGQDFPEWETVHLGDLGSFIKSYSFSRNMEGEGEYQHIHYGDIHSKFSGIILSQTEIPSLIIDSDSSYTLLEDGDVIFADASEDTSDLGKSVVLLEVDNRKIIGGLHTLCFRPDNRLDSLFLHFFTQTDEYRKFIKANANGVSVYGLSKPALSSLEIPLPDIKEQIKISSFLYNLSRKIELLKRKKMELEEMKRGFMSQMFV
ncbi:restriction endonuclease subunit S [Brevibacillus borstelensis]|uniref:restriction endonuclease subunit S n=1 Tax=Brevibacillus borstelensis TaxID=45462 RepID=UPI00046AD42E|nr:restriction endonuclease subunit S [Brevibacillus borstelensis]